MSSSAAAAKVAKAVRSGAPRSCAGSDAKISRTCRRHDSITRVTTATSRRRERQQHLASILGAWLTHDQAFGDQPIGKAGRGRGFDAQAFGESLHRRRAPIGEDHEGSELRERELVGEFGGGTCRYPGHDQTDRHGRFHISFEFGFNGSHMDVG